MGSSQTSSGDIEDKGYRLADMKHLEESVVSHLTSDDTAAGNWKAPRHQQSLRNQIYIERNSK